MIARKRLLGDYHVGKTIGQGAFSKVRIGFHRDTGEKVAIKIIDKKQMAMKAAKAKQAQEEREKRKRAEEEKRRAALIQALQASGQPVPPELLQPLPPLKKAEGERKDRHANSAVPNATSVQNSPSPHAASIMPESIRSHYQQQQQQQKGSAQVSTGSADSARMPSSVGGAPAETSATKPQDSSTAKLNQGIGNRTSTGESDKGYMPEFVGRLQTEVQLLMRLDHPNVIKIYQVLETDDECYVIMEYASGGELIDYIAAKGHLTEREARRFFRQIISALDHCHLANVVHRDLKLENLLLNDDHNILISDFGLGRTFRSDIDDLMKTFCGTPNYAAVELISGIPYIGVKSDIWAVGIILYVMMTGRPPFHGENISALYSKIKAVDYKCPDYFSQELRALLARILVRDPNERITMDELRRHPWVTADERESPPRVMPRATGNGDACNPTQFIKGIIFDQNCIIYTFRQHTPPKKPTDEFIPALSKRRRSRSSNAAEEVQAALQQMAIRAQNGENKQSDGEDGEDQLSPLPEPFIAAKSNLIRRMSLQDSPSRHATAGSGAQDTVNGTTARQRRFTMAGSFLRKDKELNSPYENKDAVPNVVEPEISFHRRMSLPSVSLSILSPNALSPDSGRASSASRGGFESSPTSPSDSIIVASRVGLDEAPTLTEDHKKDFFAPNMTAEKIQEWHMLHKPPRLIRTIRFAFSSATTSDLPPSTIFQEVHRVLILTQARYQKQLTFKRIDSYYVFDCRLTRENADDCVQFEIEVCKVWLMKLHGVKIKRNSGSALIFKELYDSIVYDLKL